MYLIFRGCLKDNDFVTLLNSGGIDPDDEDEDYWDNIGVEINQKTFYY